MISLTSLSAPGRKKVSDTFFWSGIVFALLVPSMALAVQDPSGRSADQDDPFVVVLGIVQDAGFPQAGCKKSCCVEAWRDPAARRNVASLAIVDPKTNERWIIDTTPDFRLQLRALDAIEKPAATPDLAGILLTHGHMGHYTGLLFLGHESIGAKDVPVHVMPRMARFLSEHGPWDQLVKYRNIALREMAADVAFKLNERITVTPFRVPHREEYTEVVGFLIQGPQRSIAYVPDIDKWTRWDRRVEDLIAGVDVAYVDGTFYAAGENPERDMSAIPHPFIAETMNRFESEPAAERAKIRFIHLNHTNPALDPNGEARRKIEAAGFKVAAEGERVSF